MDVIGTIDLNNKPQAFPARRYFSDGSFREVSPLLEEEHLMSVYINDMLTFQLGCSADHLVELVVGRMFTEGMIASIDEIDCVSICDFSLVAQVYLKNRTADLSRREPETVPTCCTNNRTLNRFFENQNPLQNVIPIAWSPSWVFEVARAFSGDSVSHRLTRGTHSCWLADEQGIRCCYEDIGRHNAFDKAIGASLINDVDLRKCLAFTSGRVPTDMVAKAIRARIPIFVSKTVATDKTVELARRYDLTLICSANSRSMDVLNDPFSKGDSSYTLTA